MERVEPARAWPHGLNRLPTCSFISRRIEATWRWTRRSRLRRSQTLTLLSTISCVVRFRLMKLHRDNYYFYAEPERKEAAPISIIIMTLAAHAYHYLAKTRGMTASDSLEVVLELIEPHAEFH